MSNYLQPDATGFYLAVHSWTVLRNPPGTSSPNKIGKTLYGRKAASNYSRPFFPEIAENDKLESADKALFQKNLIQAAEEKKVLCHKSWRLEGTYSKTEERPQTVTSDWAAAIDMVDGARRKEAGLASLDAKDLIDHAMAREVLAIEGKLKKNKWKLADLIDLGERHRFDPTLPDISVSAAIDEFLAWGEVQTKIPRSHKNPKPKMSPMSLRSHRTNLEKVRRYFEKKSLMKLMEEGVVQAFCTGSDPIPVPTVMTKKQSETKGDTAYGNTDRPWNPPTVSAVAGSIRALLKWAFTPGISHPNGVRAYLPKLRKDELWYPERDDDGDQYLKDAKTATPYEYRAWIDTAWPTRFAARVALETFAGLRPSEIHAPDSSINWEECYFTVGRSCKTGHRQVPLSDNIMLMLFVLRSEGRLDLSWNAFADPQALTLLHAQMGYKAADSVLARIGPPDEFRDAYPLRFHKSANRITGKLEKQLWEYWTVKCPRHTFGSVVYKASMRNAGVTAALLGHHESQFLHAYAGKVHAELWHGSIYRACRSFFQCLPKQLRAVGLSERDMGIPAYFLIKPDDRKAENRDRLLELIDKAHAQAPSELQRQIQAVKTDKTFAHTKVELATTMKVDVTTISRWADKAGFPLPTPKGYIVEEVIQWAKDNDLPKPINRNDEPTRVPLADGKTGFRMLRDLAKAMHVSETTLSFWRDLPSFPCKSNGLWVLEEVITWAKANEVPHPRYGHGTAVLKVDGRTVFKMRKDLLEALGIAAPTLHAWQELPDFPGRSGIGWVLEDIQAWAKEHGRKHNSTTEVETTAGPSH